MSGTDDTGGSRTGLAVLTSSLGVQIHAIVLAGGAGDRFGAEMPKQFVRLAGEPILLRSIRARGGGRIDDLVVVSHPELDRPRPSANWPRRAAVDPGLRGRRRATRNESTRNGLAPSTAPTMTWCWSTTRSGRSCRST